MFHLAKALVCLYVIGRLILPLPWPRWLKLAVSLVMMIVFQHSLITLLIFGTMFSPEVPRVAMVIVNWLAGAILLACGMQLIVDICSLLVAAVRRRRITVPSGLRYSCGAAALAIAAYGVGQAIRVPPLHQVEIEVRDLPDEFDGYKIVQLTDLHISRLFERPWVEKVVSAANAQKADLIVITGDLIDGTLQAREQDVAPLADLEAKDGVFTIPGNHEYYFGRNEWMEKYRELGLSTLSNSHVEITRHDAKIVLAGVNDVTASDFGMDGPDVARAIAGRPADASVLLLDHQPKNARSAALAGVDLQLSGHTHGGMIRGFDRFIASYNNGFVSGLYDVDGMKLYVNNGTALWIGFATGALTASRAFGRS